MGEPLEAETAGATTHTTGWWRKLVQWGWQLANDDGVSTSAGARSAIAWSDSITNGDVAREATFTFDVGDGSATTLVVAIFIADFTQQARIR